MAHPLMEESLEIMFLGQGHTLVRPYRGAQKLRVESGKTVTVAKAMAKELLVDSGNWAMPEEKRTPRDKREKELKKLNNEELQEVWVATGFNAEGEQTKAEKIALILTREYGS